MACFGEDAELEVVGTLAEEAAEADGAAAHEEDVKPEVVGSPREEAGKAAGVAAAAAGGPPGDRCLAKLGGVVYPSIPLRAFFHPTSMAIMLLVPVLASAWPPLLPSGTWEGAEKAPIGGAHAERRYPMFFPVFWGVLNTYILALGQAPLCVLVANYLTYIVLGWLSQYFLGTAAPAFPLTHLVTCVWAFKRLKQRKLVFLEISLLVTLTVLVNTLYQHLGKIVEIMPSRFIAGCLPSCISIGYNKTAYLLFSFLWRRCARPGLPPTMLSASIAMVLAAGEAIRVVGMLASSSSTIQVLGSMSVLIMGDMVTRFQVLPYCASLVCCKTFVVGPGTDALLRLRFIVGYLPVLPAMSFMTAAAVSGAAWARQLWIWVVLALYVGSNIASDIVVTFAHWDRQGLRSFFTTMKQLSSQPQAHWPKWQETTELRSHSELWSPSSVACRWRWCSDELLSAWSALLCTIGFLLSGFAGFFSDCYILVHEDNC